MSKLLTIGMSTFDDYEGVYFTIQALRMYHPIVMSEDVEIIVLDNNPTSIHGEKCRDLIKSIKNGKYIPYTDMVSSFSKYHIIPSAQGTYYLGLDCHVLLEAGFIDNLLSYYISNPTTNNLIQGPLILDDNISKYTHFNPEWRGNMYGTWGTNKLGISQSLPFEIEMQGMGMFSCKTSEFPIISSRFNAFGGEEGYIHEKFRQRGGRCVCHPKLGWMHRFNRPYKLPYKNTFEDIIRNYIIGYLDLYKDPSHKLINEALIYFEKFVSMDKMLSILKDEASIICG